jgi:GNAT superfamily N-acetyltransferase
MIRELTQHDLTSTFFDLFAEVECGTHFHADNPRHVAWLRNRIATHIARGTRFYSLYSPSEDPFGFVGVLIEESLNGAECLGPRAEILDIGVVPEHRRKGHGAELLAHAEALAKSAGAYSLYVATWAGSHEAIAFYGKNGYVPVAALPCIHGPDDVGDLYMRKTLRGS